jgi:hypothetical protein
LHDAGECVRWLSVAQQRKQISYLRIAGVQVMGFVFGKRAPILYATGGASKLFLTLLFGSDNCNGVQDMCHPRRKRAPTVNAGLSKKEGRARSKFEQALF